MSAAPLKRVIESLTDSHKGCFRAHVSAAPLKRGIDIRKSTDAARFPRSRERGPIEACFALAGAGAGVGRFRAHVSAAPLKRESQIHGFLIGSGFRAHVSAAPLKR